jgi:hypothetical protein
MRTDFDEFTLMTLGRAVAEEDFPAKDLTPDTDYIDPSDYDPDYGNLEVKVSPEIGDTYVGAEIQFPRGGILKKGRVASRKRDADGNPIGLANDNRILDTREYVIQLDDGDQAELNVNLIAESMYAQCDPDGHKYFLLESIVNHRKLDTAVKLKDQTRLQTNGRAYKRGSTIGWQLCCQWPDGSTSWIDLKDIKE